MANRSVWYLSRKLGIGRSTAYRLVVERREIDYIRVGSLIRIADEDIDDYIKRHKKLARTH